MVRALAAVRIRAVWPAPVRLTRVIFSLPEMPARLIRVTRVRRAQVGIPAARRRVVALLFAISCGLVVAARAAVLVRGAVATLVAAVVAVTTLAAVAALVAVPSGGAVRRRLWIAGLAVGIATPLRRLWSPVAWPLELASPAACL